MATILLVEDDSTNRDIISRYLMLLGYQIVIARDGMQAVTMAQTERPNLILMDMRLPVLDGWEATRRIKAMPATRTIPIVALTAYAMEDERRRCLAAGCDDYETKPVEFPRLLAKIRAILAANGLSFADEHAR
jgi:two-component system cell cycle response regulator DivK